MSGIFLLPRLEGETASPTPHYAVDELLFFFFFSPPSRSMAFLPRVARWWIKQAREAWQNLDSCRPPIERGYVDSNPSHAMPWKHTPSMPWKSTPCPGNRLRHRACETEAERYRQVLLNNDDALRAAVQLCSCAAWQNSTRFSNIRMSCERQSHQVRKHSLGSG